MQNRLKLGFFIQPVHPPTRAYGDVLREDREAVVLADRLGYCEAFIGEHISDLAETITDPSTKQFMDDFRRVAIPADAIARAIAFAVEQPDDVDVSELIVRPTASGF